MSAVVAVVIVHASSLSVVVPLATVLLFASQYAAAVFAAELRAADDRHDTPVQEPLMFTYTIVVVGRFVSRNIDGASAAMSGFNALEPVT